MHAERGCTLQNMPWRVMSHTNKAVPWARHACGWLRAHSLAPDVIVKLPLVLFGPRSATPPLAANWSRQ